MSKTEQEIIQGFKELAKSEAIIVPAVVKSVDENKKTITAEYNGIEYENVRLNAHSSGETYMLPTIGSWVLIAFIENSDTDAFVVSLSQIDKIVFQKGKNGGLIIIDELTKQLEKNNKILQAILTVLTSSPIPEPGNGAPSALQIALSSSLSGKSIADFTKIENDKILH